MITKIRTPYYYIHYTVYTLPLLSGPTLPHGMRDRARALYTPNSIHFRDCHRQQLSLIVGQINSLYYVGVQCTRTNIYIYIYLYYIMSYTMCMCACSCIYIEHRSNHVDTLISLWENFEPQILIRFVRVYTYTINIYFSVK